MPARTLAEHLGSVCASEGVPAEASALAVVARAGAGSVRDSLSVLGQLLAGAGPEGLTYAGAITSLGLTDTSLIDDFVAALSAGSAADMFGIVDSVISAGHDPRRFVTDILDRLRDLIVLRADHEALAKGLIDVPEDEGERMLAQAQSLGLAELSRAADLVSVGLGQIKGATAPRLQLELLCARLALPGPGRTSPRSWPASTGWSAAQAQRPQDQARRGARSRSRCPGVARSPPRRQQQVVRGLGLTPSLPTARRRPPPPHPQPGQQAPRPCQPLLVQRAPPRPRLLPVDLTCAGTRRP